MNTDPSPFSDRSVPANPDEGRLDFLLRPPYSAAEEPPQQPTALQIADSIFPIDVLWKVGTSFQ